MTSSIVVIQPTELTPSLQDSHPQERLTFPLKDVVMWIREGGEVPHSQFDANQLTLRGNNNNNEEDPFDGYEQESEEDIIVPSEGQGSSKLNLPVPVSESEEEDDDEAEKGYEGDDDCDDLDSLSIDTTDSLVLAAERLPHLVCHPQRFEPLQKAKASSSSRIPRRRGPRVSCVLRRKAAGLNRSSIIVQNEDLLPSKTKCEEKEDTHEARDLVPSLRPSIKLLRSQDSLTLTRERLEREHELTSDDDDSFFDQEDLVPKLRSSFKLLRSQDSLLLAKERLEHQRNELTSDDDSFFHQEFGTPIKKAPSPPASVSFEEDITYLHSPRAIIHTQSHDAFLKKRTMKDNGKVPVEGSISFPNLSVVNNGGAKVAFRSSCH